MNLFNAIGNEVPGQPSLGTDGGHAGFEPPGAVLALESMGVFVTLTFGVPLTVYDIESKAVGGNVAAKLVTALSAMGASVDGTKLQANDRLFDFVLTMNLFRGLGSVEIRSGEAVCRFTEIKSRADIDHVGRACDAVWGEIRGLGSKVRLSTIQTFAHFATVEGSISALFPSHPGFKKVNCIEFADVDPTIRRKWRFERSELIDDGLFLAAELRPVADESSERWFGTAFTLGYWLQQLLRDSGLKWKSDR